ncbi:Oidioi.mRNA.OKI2018_I69.XSR.g14268.t1.cds [Oikopleura dioica]|uniref:Oidioi.mRNA.OKI2018_I69.XSR.g14268.t1.cds n=1 Tax=Oikopleura dioica TaxID=34765 RepID=A0ABN7SE97_OIKDI|nr:Oidioi.mRNA.OKI2018_I69.XSR.g14268.t1.cds [Oikopleura dioica]
MVQERSRTTVRFNLTRPSAASVRSAQSAGSFLSRQPSDDDKDWNKARADPDTSEEISFFIHYWKIFLRVLFALTLSALTFGAAVTQQGTFSVLASHLVPAVGRAQSLFSELPAFTPELLGRYSFNLWLALILPNLYTFANCIYFCIFRQAQLIRKNDKSIDWFHILLPAGLELVFVAAQSIFAFFICPLMVRPLIIASGQLVTFVPLIFKIVAEFSEFRDLRWRRDKTLKIVKCSVCVLAFIAGAAAIIAAVFMSPNFMVYDLI